MLKTVIIIIVMFEVLILGHEFGHYITAKKVGITVNEFSIGMGPVLFKRMRKGTQFSLRAFPIGGFVSMEGEDVGSVGEGSFDSKTIPQKILVVSAGSIMNYLMALFLLILMVFIIGNPTNSLRDIVPEGPADTVGIVAGDTIVSINGKPTDTWQDVKWEIAQAAAGESITVEIDKNDGTENTFKNVEVLKDEKGANYIGIYSAYDRNIFYCIKNGVALSGILLKAMYQALEMLITGDVPMKEVVGPVGIVSIMGDAATQGFLFILYLTSLLSMNLAVMNLLPLPALDGGRLLFLIIYAVSRKKVNPELEGKIHYVGFILLMALTLLITVKDINQFILN